MYVEAYGNVYRNLKFIALKFIKPILRIRLNDTVETIDDTHNILVLYSNKKLHLKTNTLTYVVNAECSGAIQVKDGDESELLLALLNRSEIYKYVFHHSTLYVVGSLRLSFNYEILPKTAILKALYTLTKNCLDGTFNIQHFQLCKYFKRNNLEWKKWNSWWYLIKLNLNHTYYIKQPITLQLAHKLANIYKKSQYDFELENSNFYNCEIELSTKPLLGIMYKMENDKLLYVSPMIVSKYVGKKSFKDVNFIECNYWLPLYFNKTVWLSEGIYFYILQVYKYTKHLKLILNYLKDSKIDKYIFIKKDLSIVFNILQ